MSLAWPGAFGPPMLYTFCLLRQEHDAVAVAALEALAEHMIAACCQ
jgi:hypothetical protein